MEPLQIIFVVGQSRDPEAGGGVVAHAWLKAPPGPLDELETVAEREQRTTYLTQMAIARGRLDVLVDPAARQERLAAALARAWGFTGAAMDGRRAPAGSGPDRRARRRAAPARRGSALWCWAREKGPVH